MTRLDLVRPVLASVLVAALVSGCGAVGDPAPSPTDGSSAASPATASTTESPTDPTSEPTTDPNAATGKLIELEGLSFRLPEDYHVVRNTNGRIFEADRRGSLVGDPIQVIIVDSLGVSYSLRKLARIHNKGSLYSMDAAYLAPVTFAGQEWYHLEGQVRPLAWAAAYGFNDADHDVDLSFEFSTQVPLAKRRAIVDSVLATVELT